MVCSAVPNRGESFADAGLSEAYSDVAEMAACIAEFNEPLYSIASTTARLLAAVYSHASFGYGCDSGFCGVVQIAIEDVSVGVGEVFQWREIDEIADAGRIRHSAFSQVDCFHLGNRTNGLGKSSSDRFESRDERRRDSAQSGDHDAEFSFVRISSYRVLLSVTLL